MKEQFIKLSQFRYRIEELKQPPHNIDPKVVDDLIKMYSETVDKTINAINKVFENFHRIKL